MTDGIKKYVLQDALKLLQNNKTLISVAKGATNLASLWDRIQNGAGIGDWVKSLMNQLMESLLKKAGNHVDDLKYKERLAKGK